MHHGRCSPVGKPSLQENGECKASELQLPRGTAAAEGGGVNWAPLKRFHLNFPKGKIKQFQQNQIPLPTMENHQTAMSREPWGSHHIPSPWSCSSPLSQSPSIWKAETGAGVCDGPSLGNWDSIPSALKGRSHHPSTQQRSAEEGPGAGTAGPVDQDCGAP